MLPLQTSVLLSDYSPWKTSCIDGHRSPLMSQLFKSASRWSHAAVAVRQPFVVEAQEVEDGRIEFVGCDRVLDDLAAEFVQLAVDDPLVDAAAHTSPAMLFAGGSRHVTPTTSVAGRARSGRIGQATRLVGAIQKQRW
jgi:hypothetical protein